MFVFRSEEGGGGWRLWGLRSGLPVIGEGLPSLSVAGAYAAMVVRPPQSLSFGLQPETGWNVLDHELRQQKAQTLGTLGGQVEGALAALRALEAEPDGSDRELRRSALLDAAADRVWAFMIQRELCGLQNWPAVVREYGIPREVLNRVGQVRRKAD